jgi:hypothetical protein
MSSPFHAFDGGPEESPREGIHPLIRDLSLRQRSATRDIGGGKPLREASAAVRKKFLRIVEI